MNLDEIYTPLEEAKKEIQRRWKDEELKKKIEKFLGGDIPDFFKKEPRAAYVRDVISPNNEFLYFWDIVKDIGLKPILVEYSAGKFVAKNINKYHLCRMYFNHGVGKHGGGKIECSHVVNFNTMEGKPMSKVCTTEGEGIINYHHKFLKKSVVDVDMKDIVDFSKWFDQHKIKTKHWYMHYLALFICYGVLFDNFITNESEKEFTEKKILPSLIALTKKFGVKPLIVPLSPVESENDLYWWLYPGNIKKYINNK